MWDFPMRKISSDATMSFIFFDWDQLDLQKQLIRSSFDCAMERVQRGWKASALLFSAAMCGLSGVINRRHVFARSLVLQLRRRMRRRPARESSKQRTHGKPQQRVQC